MLREHFVSEMLRRFETILDVGLPDSGEEVDLLMRTQIVVNNHINHILGAVEQANGQDHSGGRRKKSLEAT